MQKETCIHLEFLTNQTHFYFGSISAIYELFNKENIGVAKQTLYQFKIEQGKPYKNSKCIIRKGDFRRKKGNRGKC